MKFVVHLLNPIPVCIFNTARETSTFLSQIQKVKVTVLYKGGDINNLTNYRPIPILPVFPKALEKVIHTKLTSFLD